MKYGVTDILQLIGSISLFLFAMKTMSEGIQKATGSALRSFLNVVTTNKYFGVLSGFLITGIIQSSSATTVMIVSFVNAGLLSLKQSIGVIMGANMGTTVTSWLINGLGFSELGLMIFALPAIGLGVPLLYSGAIRWKSWGEFLIGFGLLFLGLDLMKNSVPIVEDFDIEFLSFLKQYTESWYSLPLFIIIGTIVAIILQSSSTAMGLTIVLVSQGWLPMTAAVGLILGENIGTTITANLASIVANVNAKRAARVHTIFNLIGVFWVLAIIPWFIDLVDYLNMGFFGSKYSVHSANLYHRGLAMTGAVAIFHTLFNAINALIQIHFIPQIILIAKKLVPSEEGEKKSGVVAVNNFVDIPEMAMMQANKQLILIADISEKLVKKYRKLQFSEIEMNLPLLKKLDKYQRKANELHTQTATFLIEISRSNNSENVAEGIIKLLSICNELQRVVDKVHQLCMIEKTCYNEGVEFTKEMKEDLCELAIEVEKAHATMKNNLINWDKNINLDMSAAAEVHINKLRDKLKEKYLNKLDSFSGDFKTALYYRDSFNELEKAGDYIFQVNQFL